ncbi:MAG: phosphoribosylanthranilate isomerase [Clostridium sp.]|jgi:phosphoribosylanthranilate isomerase|nr:phosphoribosylanthranilate isomerase [Clostridium sp.]
METKIKICGLSRPQDVEYANLVQPDYVGFVFAGSRRRVDGEQAAKLRARLAPGILAVGVFADADRQEILRCQERAGLDLIQLHGAETREEIRFLQEATGKPLIKAFQVASRQEVRLCLSSPADYLLFDSGQGSGKTFDWSFLEGIEDAQGFPESRRKRFFLAGGLHAGNLAAAAGRVRPFAVDVSSGAETDGKKDLEKMKRLVEIVRGKKAESGCFPELGGRTL